MQSKEKVLKALQKAGVSDDKLEEVCEFVSRVSIETPNRIQNLYKHMIPAVVMTGDYDNLYDRFSQIYLQKGEGATFRKMVLYYGEDLAKEKFESYREFQSKKNTFEYKREKYGWDEEQFKSYNNSRAITLDTMISRYGVIEGTKKFEEYREKQRDSGCSLRYFQEKYGENEGLQKYNEVNRTKAITLENMIRKYGEEVGKEKYFNAMETFSRCSFYSKSSQLCFSEIDQKFEVLRSSIWKEKSGKEFGSYCNEASRYFFYDYVVVDKKLVIEYHGDHWHANPKLYDSHEVPKVRKQLKETAGELWEKDRIKLEHIRSRGFNCVVIWESEWQNDRDVCYQRIEDAINSV